MLIEIYDSKIVSKITQAVIKHVCIKEQCVQHFQNFLNFPLILGKSATFPESTKTPAAGSEAAPAHPPSHSISLEAYASPALPDLEVAFAHPPSQFISNFHSSKENAAPELPSSRAAPLLPSPHPS